MELDRQQEEALTIVANGHNLVVLGGPGTGKSTVIKHIFRRLKEDGRSVAVTASTGIAAIGLCTPQCQASTIHRFTGLFQHSDYFTVVYIKSQCIFNTIHAF
jgi:ATP-dependent DNA helicase PIF1